MPDNPQCERCNRTQTQVGEMTGISKRFDGRMMCDACVFVEWQAAHLEELIEETSG